MPALAFYPKSYRYLFGLSAGVYLVLIICALVLFGFVWLWRGGEVVFAVVVYMGLPLYQLLLSFAAYRMFQSLLQREPQELFVDPFAEGLFWDRCFFMTVFLGCFLVPALLLGQF